MEAATGSRRRTEEEGEDEFHGKLFVKKVQQEGPAAAIAMARYGGRGGYPSGRGGAATATASRRRRRRPLRRRPRRRGGGARDARRAAGRCSPPGGSRTRSLSTVSTSARRPPRAGTRL